MSMPFYVAPEQVMKDRADYAKKGIARGRSLIAAMCADGILLCAENPSATLRKISEIYDRIAFAGVGRYNEFDQLRVAGVRHADLKGYSYSREDVDARSLANAYAQALGQTFTHEMKPLEVEILVAEVADEGGRDQLFHINYDGTVTDKPHRAVLGGDASAIEDRFEAGHDPSRRPPRPWPWPWPPWPGPIAPWVPRSSRPPSSTAPASARLPPPERRRDRRRHRLLRGAGGASTWTPSTTSSRTIDRSRP